MFKPVAGGGLFMRHPHLTGGTRAAREALRSAAVCRPSAGSHSEPAKGLTLQPNGKVTGRSKADLPIGYAVARRIQIIPECIEGLRRR
jgi:hypothetical protein